MVRGLLDCGVERVGAACPVVLPSFPRSRRLWVRASRHDVDSTVTIVAPAFVNFGPIRVLTQVFSVFVALLGLASRLGRPNAILTYNLNPGYVLAGYLASKLWRVPLVPVAADLNPPDAKIGGLRGLDARLQIALLKRATGVIAFSSRTQKDFDLRQPVIKVEPGVDAADFPEPAQREPIPNQKKTLMFSGTLIEASGILWLLDAFSLIDDPDVELWVTGRGHLETEIARRVETDKRVRLLGFVSRDQLLRLYGEATLLVNPRPIWLPEHQYNFPSKLIQYMATGRPVITTATGDVGEYEPFVYLLRDATPAALAASIVDVCSLPQEQREQRARAAREYVLRQKTWEVETRRMYEFLRQLAAR